MGINDAFWYNLEQQQKLKFNVYDQRKAVLEGVKSSSSQSGAPDVNIATPPAYIPPAITQQAAAISIPAAVAAIPSVFQAAPQEKTKPARAAARLDDSPLSSKKPSADVDKAQRIGTPGETIPIVFARRAGTGIGGTWVQPSMVKTASKNFYLNWLDLQNGVFIT